MYDNICKFLAENFSEELAIWLLGQPINFTQLSPSELSLEPIQADSLRKEIMKESVIYKELPGKIKT